MVVAGFTVIVAVVAPPGDQEYVPPPMDGVAVNVVEEPLQIVAEFTVTVGTGFTVTVPVPVAEQPVSVYVTL